MVYIFYMEIYNFCRVLNRYPRDASITTAIGIGSSPWSAMENLMDLSRPGVEGEDVLVMDSGCRGGRSFLKWLWRLLGYLFTSQPKLESGSNAMDTRKDWCPQDDGIEVTLPHSEKSPSRESVNEYIDEVLHYGRAAKRLPVFSKIFSE